MTKTNRTFCTTSPLTGKTYTRTSHRPYTIVAFHQVTGLTSNDPYYIPQLGDEKVTYHADIAKAQKESRWWDNLKGRAYTHVYVTVEG